MADDTVAYARAGSRRAGTPGGVERRVVIALLFAQRRPDLVARMVLIGQYYNASGRASGGELVAYLKSPEAITFLRRAYDSVSPDV